MEPCSQPFGDRDEWSDRAAMSAHTRAEVDALPGELQIVEFDRIEGGMGWPTGQGKY